jgi:hypothetical protein
MMDDVSAGAESAPALFDDGSQGAATAAGLATINRRRIKTENKDVPVETIHTWVTRGKLCLQPDFQRNYVWTPLKASRLIESILLEIPLPVVYVAEEADGTYSVVDGQQRLASVSGFLSGKFPGDGGPFRLSNLRVARELNGKQFSELPQTAQEQILAASLRLTVITRDSDPEVKFEVFERLNQESCPLSHQELRHCVYRGPYNDLVGELAQNPTFRKIFGFAEPRHRRMLDRQYVLRFLALWHATHLKYKTGMLRFMNQDMAQYRFADKAELNRARAAFEKSMDIAYTVFGARAFRRFVPGTDKDANGFWETRLNAALYDTLLYTFSFYEKPQVVPVKDLVVEEFLDVVTADRDFAKFISTATDTTDRVRYRIDVWRQRLQSLVGTGKKEPRCFSRALKKEFYDRDPTCAICKQHIVELDDAQLDHERHYWRGGKTVRENARLAHRYCNLARGKRV